MAFRIIVADVAQCYQALGLIHGSYQVIPGRFKDYISVPKPNGYRSLHTGVIGPLGQRIELQIRTEEMQDQAERGVAAHWIYKQGGPSTDAPQYAWLRSLIEILDKAPNAEEFLEHTKLEMFHDQVFCFTPKGKLIALPQGRDADRLRLRRAQPGRRHLRRLQDQRPHAAVAHPALQRRPGRDHHVEGADAVADLGTLRRHRQGQGRDPPLHPHAPARAVPAARQVAARQDLPRGGLRGHREGPRRRARQLQAGHHGRPDRRRRRRPHHLARGHDGGLSGPEAAAAQGRRRRRRADLARAQQGGGRRRAGQEGAGRQPDRHPRADPRHGGALRALLPSAAGRSHRRHHHHRQGRDHPHHRLQPRWKASRNRPSAGSMSAGIR